MKLADLRKLSIRKQIRIRFRLRNGLDCVITEHGVAQVPALKGIPDFNLEQELPSVPEFLLEPASAAGRKGPVKPRRIGREELAAMASASLSAGREGAVRPDHDDE